MAAAPNDADRLGLARRCVGIDAVRVAAAHEVVEPKIDRRLELAVDEGARARDRRVELAGHVEDADRELPR